MKFSHTKISQITVCLSLSLHFYFTNIYSMCYIRCGVYLECQQFQNHEAGHWNKVCTQVLGFCYCIL